MLAPNRQIPLFDMPPVQLTPVYLLWSDRYNRLAMRGFVCAQCANRLMRERFPAETRVRKVLESVGECWMCAGQTTEEQAQKC